MSFFRKHKKWINYNKELGIAEISAFVFGPLLAFIASIFSQNNFTIVAFSTVGDYIGYTLAYGAASFFDNRKIYWDEKKKKVNRIFFNHFGKFIIGAVFVDIIYYAARSVLNYYLLSLNVVPHLSAVFTQVIMLVLYFTLMNVMGKTLGIIDKKKR
ncbi:MAG: hypothetical protein Q8O89_02090 [Nanoarchaeota archaeon]|nr:hypothetical protein [Nanoarchaeota archaeon]